MILFWAVRDCAGHSSKVINRFLEEVLPRTRGFTAVVLIDDRQAAGSPAHAWVHRYRSGRPRTLRRFSRARAGSPGRMGTGFTTRKVLPRTRGFTNRGVRPRPDHQGSPAHARVHRACRFRDRRDHRFFRARAGSPVFIVPMSLKQKVLPRTRGFTGRATGGQPVLEGSSAHARVHLRHG